VLVLQHRTLDGLRVLGLVGVHHGVGQVFAGVTDGVGDASYFGRVKHLRDDTDVSGTAVGRPELLAGRLPHEVLDLASHAVRVPEARVRARPQGVKGQVPQQVGEVADNLVSAIWVVERIGVLAKKEVVGQDCLVPRPIREPSWPTAQVHDELPPASVKSLVARGDQFLARCEHVIPLVIGRDHRQLNERQPVRHRHHPIPGYVGVVRRLTGVGPVG